MGRVWLARLGLNEIHCSLFLQWARQQEDRVATATVLQDLFAVWPTGAIGNNESHLN